MQRSEDIKEIAIALSKAQAVMKHATKDGKNPHFGNKYASLTSIWDAARGPLTENELSVVQTTEVTESGVVMLETTLIHSSGQWISSFLPIRPIKDDPQGMGSALTYGRRYGFAALIGNAPGEDDDGVAAARPVNDGDKAEAKTAAKPKAGANKMTNGTWSADMIRADELNADFEVNWTIWAKEAAHMVNRAPDEAALTLFVENNGEPLKNFRAANKEGANKMGDHIQKKRESFTQKVAA